ncbi:hypothetical protein VTK26DRAFT_2494 [Humicola hyalothermophila]
MPGDDGTEEATTNNPFIRFKNHINANIQAGLNTLTALSSSASSSRSSSPPATMDPPPPTPDSLAPHPPNNHDNNNSNDDDITALARLPTRAEAQRAFHTFLTYSPYSPLRLAYHMPPHLTPTPRDLPAGADPSQFGWADAFEDLLLASSGVEGMSDLAEKSRVRGRWEGRRRRGAIGEGFGFPGEGLGLGLGGLGEELDELFGFGKGDRGGEVGRWGDGEGEWWVGQFGPWGGGIWPVGFGFGGFGGFGGSGLRQRWREEQMWVRRMVSGERGLMEVLFPYAEPREGYVSPRTMGEWVERRRREMEMAEKEANWRLKRLEEAKRLDEERRKRWADENAEGGRWGLFDELRWPLKVLREVLEDDLKLLGKGDDGAAADKKTKQHPDTEGDLYSTIQSAFQESERSLSNFFKTISGAWRDAKEPKPASPPKVETTETVENGITKSTTRKEFVDENGYTHTKVETTWKDEDGRVIFRQSQSSAGRSVNWQKTFNGSWPEDGEETADNAKAPKAIEDGRDKERETGDKTKEQKKEGGWFWK